MAAQQEELGMGLVDMDLVDMDLVDLDLVEAMVQDQGLDMEQVQRAILNLSKINLVKLKQANSKKFSGICKVNDFCLLQAMELDQNLLNTVLAFLSLKNIMMDVLSKLQ